MHIYIYSIFGSVPVIHFVFVRYNGIHAYCFRCSDPHDIFYWVVHNASIFYFQIQWNYIIFNLVCADSDMYGKNDSKYFQRWTFQVKGSIRRKKRWLASCITGIEKKTAGGCGEQQRVEVKWKVRSFLPPYINWIVSLSIGEDLLG